MKEGTVPPPIAAHVLIAREIYYLFVELSHVGEHEVAERRKPCTFKFFYLFYLLLQSR